MKRFISVLGLCLITGMAMAQTGVRTFDVKNSADGESVVTAFLPASDIATGRAVVACSGGGYSHLAMAKEGTDWAGYFNRMGIAYFVLKYRMPKGDRSIPIADAMNAMKMVRDSAAVWHINPYDVGIMGSSAGGHLASTISTQAEWAYRPNFSILFYPVISMNERVSHVGSINNFLGDKKGDEALVNQFSNDKQVRRHLTPPAIILLANDDRTVPPVTNGVAYYCAMRNVGNVAAMYIYPSGGHGFGFSSAFAYHEQMLSDLTSWLKSVKAPSEGAVRVACIGNSITDGSGIDMKDVYGYPAMLQNDLGDGYYVKNYGVGARTLLNKGDHPYMQEMAWRDALAFNPQIVVIKLGTNDSKPVNWRFGNEFRHDLQQMVDSLKSLPARPKIYLATPIRAFKPSYTISDSVIVNGVVPVILKVAKKNKLEVIDLHSLLTDETLIQSDGIHPNEKGAARMAEIVKEVIEKDRK
jgi:acetyl esterase/lipase/lysophospholipase L1-like esterase